MTDSNDLPHFGVNLRRARDLKGWTAQRLHEESKVALDTIRALESGKNKNPRDATIGPLAAALGLTLAELRTGTFGPGREGQAHVDTSTAQAEPLGALEHIEIAIKEAGLSPAAAQAFRDERRVGGMPYPLSVIIDIAKHRRVVELEAQAKPKFPKVREVPAEDVDD